MHCSLIIALIRYASICSASTLCTGMIDLLNILLCNSKPYFVQAGLSTRVANHTWAWTHRCKNDAYCYFMHLCSAVISNSIPVSEYWHKYPALKLSSISCSSALILVHITKNNFNSVYCPCSIAITGTSDW